MNSRSQHWTALRKTTPLQAPRPWPGSGQPNSPEGSPARTHAVDDRSVAAGSAIRARDVYGLTQGNLVDIQELEELNSRGDAFTISGMSGSAHRLDADKMAS